jgi:two-component system cell cycle sensor histidine kinase PleC
MSHELRTPLNAVLGYSELLINGIGGTLPPKQVEYAQYIHQSGTHLLNIISDILDLSKIEAGALALQEQPTEIDQLIETCMFMVRGRALSKGLQLQVEIAPALPNFQVDPIRLKQVLINLLSNAIKFTQIGSVTLCVSYDADQGLYLTVSDTGIGMTEQEMKVALEYFGRTESAFSRNHEGTGLGLPIAQRLTDLHGGEMTIHSQTGIGTSVCVRLPASRAQASTLAS